MFFFSLSVFSLSFAKRPAGTLLTRKNEKAGKQAEDGVRWEDGHRGCGAAAAGVLGSG